MKQQNITAVGTSARDGGLRIKSGIKAGARHEVYDYPRKYPVERYGIIQDIMGFPGIWVIGDTAYSVDKKTKFNTAGGPTVVGACVAMSYDHLSGNVLAMHTGDYHQCRGPKVTQNY